VLKNGGIEMLYLHIHLEHTIIRKILLIDTNVITVLDFVNGNYVYQPTPKVVFYHILNLNIFP